MLIALRSIALAMALASIWVGRADAVPIEYRMWGVVTGSLGAENFYDAGLTFSLQGDTDAAFAWTNAYSNGWESFVRPGAITGSTVTIEGLGTALTGAMMVIANPNDFCRCIGLARWTTGGPSVMDLRQTEFTLANPYDLRSSTGIISGQPVWWPGNYVNTSRGELRISYGSDVHFQATLVPVPSAALMLGPVLALLPALRRRGAGEERSP
ncbi:MAG: hypothetical protein OEW88_10140 [Gammaproteobacteria bacterium]|nr:hypothetical protein [Gammaproteobacteria bacterium]